MPGENKSSTSLRSGSKTNKLVARDFSESLGKLPPQAVDLEKAVLGALMLESHSFAQVQEFLKPDHFYLESHKEIFRAIRQLKAAGHPIDMRTVKNQLSQTGKLELIGGAVYIVELTTEVSSAANIEYHARVILEMAVKRDMILLASDVHHDAYEDTTDVFELLESKIQLFKDLHSRLSKNSAQLLKDQWLEALVVECPPPEIPLIKINGCVVATQGNHSLVVGKKKSRKTLFLVWLLVEAIKMKAVRPDEIMIFDTEQGRHHVWRLREKIYKLSGHHVPTFYLRGQSPAERREFIKGTVENWEVHPKIIVIDGIRDLMSNINDADESTQLIVWLEKLTLAHDLHVINVLHLNKTDNNARGHIGTELLNKAQVTIELELDQKTNMTQIRCESSRDKPFDSFWFTHGMDDLPEVSMPPMPEMSIDDEERLRRLKLIFDDGVLKHREFMQAIRDHFSEGDKMMGINKATRLVTRFRQAGWIVKNGKDRDPNSTYKLIVSELPQNSNGQAIRVEIPQQAPPPSLFDEPDDPD